MGCNCFSCRHRDEPRLVKAYYVGYIEACDWFLNWAKAQGIKMGSIGDDDLGGIYAQIRCNRDESDILARELPDIEHFADTSKMIKQKDQK